jgi:hypothetical protein
MDVRDVRSGVFDRVGPTFKACDREDAFKAAQSISQSARSKSKHPISDYPGSCAAAEIKIQSNLMSPSPVYPQIGVLNTAITRTWCRDRISIPAIFEGVKLLASW